MKPRMKGITCMLASTFSFTMMNVFVRMAGVIPSMQKSFFRNVISLAMALVLLAREGASLAVPRSERKHLFVRALVGTIGVLCNFYAVDHMVLSDATMLNKMSPFFTVLFAALLLKETVTLAQTALFVTAFCGSLLILKPSLSAFASPAAAIALLGGVCAGLAYAEVRLLGKRQVNRAVIIFFFSAFSCLVTAPSLVFHYAPMTWGQLGFLLLAGVAATGGQFGITYAYFYAPASEVSVYDYSQIVFSAVLGYLCFGQLADGWSFLGYVIICAAAVAMAVYNNRHERVSANSELGACK
ncbi:Riboflavin transporter [anaerobic digester metagenome]